MNFIKISKKTKVKIFQENHNHGLPCRFLQNVIPETTKNITKTNTTLCRIWKTLYQHPQPKTKIKKLKSIKAENISEKFLLTNSSIFKREIYKINM